VSKDSRSRSGVLLRVRHRDRHGSQGGRRSGSCRGEPTAGYAMGGTVTSGGVGTATGAGSPAGVWVSRPGVRSPPDVQNSVRPGGRGLPFLTTHRVPGDSPRRGWRLGTVRARSGGRQSGGITAASDPAERTSVGRCSVSCSTLIRYAGAAVDRAATAARSPGTGTAIARIPASCSSSAIA